MGRLILASHRLPVSARLERGALVVAPGAGGVASGLGTVHEQSGGVWVGWPGETWRLSRDQRRDLDRELAARRAVAVDLDARVATRFYDQFATGVLWPLFHYQLERLPLDPRGWDAYREANERFAEVIAAHARPDDTIWIHDYQLLLVPGLLRRHLPDASIGFFLHVPFPTSELFRVLRWRAELLEGMLGADLVGFHTASYADHFRRSAARILGCDVRHGRIAFGGRTVRAGAFPMGIDAAEWVRLAADPEVAAESARLRGDGRVRLVVAVDRLDYTKGIPRRLLAFERALERTPRLRTSIRLIQVAAPTREGVHEYREHRRQVEELVGRINGRFGTPDHQPIHHISRTLSREQLVALYRAAAVALVTPVRDGMNLVAKEFVASRADGAGVLVLSEFAGAAAELSGAIVVNPYDLDGVAEAIRVAVDLPPAEQRARMRAMRGRVVRHGVGAWAREFLAALAGEARRRRASEEPDGDAVSPETVLDAVVEGRAPGGRLALVLDYDGTLMPFHARPEDARPDDEILRLLAILAGHPDVVVHVVSGRRRSEVDAWLGHLPIGLHAEHGLWSRDRSGATWRRRLARRPAWLGAVRRRLDAEAAAVPGSNVEEKEASIVWHYRNVPDPEGESAATRLRAELGDSLRGSDALVSPGARIVEVREVGIHKGLVIAEVGTAEPEARMVVIGDDATDEDMFGAAPPTAVTVKVGPGETAARFRLHGPEQVRALLGELIARLEPAMSRSGV